MSIALVTLTHGQVGESLVAAAVQIVGRPAPAVRHLVFAHDDDPDRVRDELLATIAEIDTGAGVLVLTDVFGATPCNIARRVGPGAHVRVLSGMNLPMILRVLNYADLDLETVTRRAAEGGRIGVIECDPPET